MTDDSTLPIVTVHATVVDTGGGFKAVYQPDPAAAPGRMVRLRYLLDTAGWAFDAIAYAAPFTDLNRISATEFHISDDGAELGTYGFSIELVPDPPVDNGDGAGGIDSQAQVTNGPPTV